MKYFKRLSGYFLSACCSLGLSTQAYAQTLAVTEFLSNSNGAEPTLEWVEIFNFGPSSIDLTDFQVTDGEGTFTFSSGMIASGEFIILADNSAAFQADWPTVPTEIIFGDSPLALANAGDNIDILNPSNDVIWSLVYPDGETEGNSVYLAIDDFINTSGSTITFAGDDSNGLLGYETNDPGDEVGSFSSVLAEDFGSPGVGNYTTIPEPSTIVGTIAALSFGAWLYLQKISKRIR